ncbi:MAG TPA: hypothetical protein VIJ20_08430 [Solirubrobacteraceae bacterium]
MKEGTWPLRAAAVAFIICSMTIADDHLAEVGSGMDAWDLEHARALLESVERLPAHLREALVLREASDLVMSLVIKLVAWGEPGVDAARDADWAVSAAMARRSVLTYRAAGLDGAVADSDLALLDRICSLIGSWPEADWAGAVGRRVEELVDARRRGRERGEQLRPSRRPGEQSSVPALAWLLRHPADHYFWRARANISDPWLCAHIDERIADFAPSYEAMADQDWSAEESRSDLVVELEILDVPPGWKEPVETVVVATHRGGAAIGPELPLHLVADPDAQFNGMLISLLRGERWLTCASLRKDGTALPEDGTRRLAAPPPPSSTLDGRVHELAGVAGTGA